MSQWGQTKLVRGKNKKPQAVDYLEIDLLSENTFPDQETLGPHVIDCSSCLGMLIMNSPLHRFPVWVTPILNTLDVYTPSRE